MKDHKHFLASLGFLIVASAEVFAGSAKPAASRPEAAPPAPALCEEIITTVAGKGGQGSSGDGGPALLAKLYSSQISIDHEGNIYIVDNHRVRMVDTQGDIHTVAGTGNLEFSGDDGPAIGAGLYPTDIAVDSKGNLYIVDGGNNRVRMVDTQGKITTIAGTGEDGFSGEGGRATLAAFDPRGIDIDSKGNIYIATASPSEPRIHCRVLKIDTDGIITSVAGTATAGVSGDGGQATQAELTNPQDVAVDSKGNIYIADGDSHRVRMVDTQGIITTVAGTGTPGFSGDGGPASQAELFYPRDVAVDSQGNLYIADVQNNRLRKVDTQGKITTVAGTGIPEFSGDGGPAILASVHPYAIDVSSEGDVYIADVFRILKTSCGTPAIPADISKPGYERAKQPFVNPSLPPQKRVSPSLTTQKKGVLKIKPKPPK